jgi:FtsZ-binding cell division protein ZapB
MMRDQNDNSLDAVFEPLEMKIQRVVDLCRELREERALMQKEIAVLLQVETITDEKRKLERRIDHQWPNDVSSVVG